MKLKDRVSQLNQKTRTTISTELTVLRSSENEIVCSWPIGSNVDSPNLESCIQDSFSIPDDLYFQRIQSANVGKISSIQHNGLSFILYYRTRLLYIGVDNA